MKYYTTIAVSLLLSAVLIFNPAAKAATSSATLSFAQSSVRAYLYNQYNVQYNLDSTDNPYPSGNYNVVVYKAIITPLISCSVVDSYLTGSVSYQVSCGYSTPAGWSFSGISKSHNEIFSNDLYSFRIGRDGDQSSIVHMKAYFCNMWNINAISMGDIEFYISFTYPATQANVPDPDPYITVNPSGAINSQNVSASVDPTDRGMVDIVSQGIINAINDNSMPFDDILHVLEDIRTQDQTNYTTIVAYLADNDTFNSTLYTWLTTVLEDDFGALLDDTTYISSVLNAARNLINSMNSRDSLYYPIFEAALDLANTRLQTLINLMSETPAEAASMDNAINQMESKQAAINDYSLPAAGNIMGNANSYVNQGSAGMNLLATILNQPLYILILMTVISLAFVSYLLYGKGV